MIFLSYHILFLLSIDQEFLLVPPRKHPSFCKRENGIAFIFHSKLTFSLKLVTTKVFVKVLEINLVSDQTSV